jgi:hypothetical protein
MQFRTAIVKIDAALVFASAVQAVATPTPTPFFTPFFHFPQICMQGPDSLGFLPFLYF